MFGPSLLRTVQSRASEVHAAHPAAGTARHRWALFLRQFGNHRLGGNQQTRDGGRTLQRGPLGPYQVQAAIAAIHAEAERAEDTDWPQIVVLYQILAKLDPSPVVTLNHAVALAMACGPRAGLALLQTLDADDRMSRQHRLHAVRAHLLEMAGDREAARSCYQSAARLTTSLPEQRYLDDRASRLTPSTPASGPPVPVRPAPRP